jgi:hypothetical protein
MNRKRGIRALAVALGVSLLASRAAAEARIGVYFDAAGTQCMGTIEAGHAATVYIVAKVGPGEDLPAGAEFRFVGLPSAWTAFPVPNPGGFSLGDPFAQGGSIGGAWPCEAPGAGTTLVLYTVLIVASEAVNDVRLELLARNPPSNPNFPCALVVLCPFPFDKRCVETDPCFVNVTTPGPCATTAAVPATWTAVRSFFR